jgi:hypothetical protein
MRGSTWLLVESSVSGSSYDAYVVLTCSICLSFESGPGGCLGHGPFVGPYLAVCEFFVLCVYHYNVSSRGTDGRHGSEARVGGSVCCCIDLGYCCVDCSLRPMVLFIFLAG